MELVMKIFVNIPGVPLTTQSQFQMDALLFGTQQQIPVTPTRYAHCFAVRFEDTFRVFEQKRPPVFVMTKF